MKAFVYEPQGAGLTEWPSGTLRLEGIEITSDPNSADVFLCPGNLSIFLKGGELDRARLEALPHFKGNESRHVFLDVSDNFKKSLNLPCMFIRCDARDWMLATDPNTIQMAWPVEDFTECIPVPEGGFTRDLGFHGWNWSESRQKAIESVSGDRRIKCDMATYRDFFGYLKEPAEIERRRVLYRQSLQTCRMSLCPESIPGVFPYRFWEALSAGRVPVLVGSDFVWPFADEIPYKDFCIHVERVDANRTNWAVGDFLENASDAEIIRRGKLGRVYWEKWLNREKWPELMTYTVRRQLQKMGHSGEALSA